MSCDHHRLPATQALVELLSAPLEWGGSNAEIDLQRYNPAETEPSFRGSVIVDDSATARISLQVGKTFRTDDVCRLFSWLPELTADHPLAAELELVQSAREALVGNELWPVERWLLQRRIRGQTRALRRRLRPFMDTIGAALIRTLLGHELTHRGVAPGSVEKSQLVLAGVTRGLSRVDPRLACDPACVQTVSNAVMDQLANAFLHQDPEFAQLIRPLDVAHSIALIYRDEQLIDLDHGPTPLFELFLRAQFALFEDVGAHAMELLSFDPKRSPVPEEDVDAVRSCVRAMQRDTSKTVWHWCCKEAAEVYARHIPLDEGERRAALAALPVVLGVVPPEDPSIAIPVTVGGRLAASAADTAGLLLSDGDRGTSTSSPAPGGVPDFKSAPLERLLHEHYRKRAREYSMELEAGRAHAPSEAPEAGAHVVSMFRLHSERSDTKLADHVLLLVDGSDSMFSLLPTQDPHETSPYLPWPTDSAIDWAHVAFYVLVRRIERMNGVRLAAGTFSWRTTIAEFREGADIGDGLSALMPEGGGTVLDVNTLASALAPVLESGERCLLFVITDGAIQNADEYLQLVKRLTAVLRVVHFEIGARIPSAIGVELRALGQVAVPVPEIRELPQLVAAAFRAARSETE